MITFPSIILCCVASLDNCVCHGSWVFKSQAFLSTPFKDWRMDTVEHMWWSTATAPRSHTLGTTFGYGECFVSFHCSVLYIWLFTVIFSSFAHIRVFCVIPCCVAIATNWRWSAKSYVLGPFSPLWWATRPSPLSTCLDSTIVLPLGAWIEWCGLIPVL